MKVRMCASSNLVASFSSFSISKSILFPWGHYIWPAAWTAFGFWVSMMVYSLRGFLDLGFIYEWKEGSAAEWIEKRGELFRCDGDWA